MRVYSVPLPLPLYYVALSNTILSPFFDTLNFLVIASFMFLSLSLALLPEWSGICVVYILIASFEKDM